MPTPPVTTIHQHFATLTDPRVDRAKHHQLLDILTIALCAVICGAESWTECKAFGQAKLPWLRTFLELPHGIPTCQHQVAIGLLERVEQDECEWAERETAELLAQLTPQPAAMVADYTVRSSQFVW